MRLENIKQLLALMIISFFVQHVNAVYKCSQLLRGDSSTASSETLLELIKYEKLFSDTAYEGRKENSDRVLELVINYLKENKIQFTTRKVTRAIATSGIAETIYYDAVVITPSEQTHLSRLARLLKDKYQIDLVFSPVFLAADNTRQAVKTNAQNPWEYFCELSNILNPQIFFRSVNVRHEIKHVKNAQKLLKKMPSAFHGSVRALMGDIYDDKFPGWGGYTKMFSFDEMETHMLELRNIIRVLKSEVKNIGLKESTLGQLHFLTYLNYALAYRTYLATSRAIEVVERQAEDDLVFVEGEKVPTVQTHIPNYYNLNYIVIATPLVDSPSATQSNKVLLLNQLGWLKTRSSDLLSLISSLGKDVAKLKAGDKGEGTLSNLVNLADIVNTFKD